MNSFIGFTDPSETPTRGSGGYFKNKKCNRFIDSIQTQTRVNGGHLENMNSFIGFMDPSETPTRGSGGHLKNKKCNGFIDSPGTPPRGSDGHLENLNVFLLNWTSTHHAKISLNFPSFADLLLNNFRNNAFLISEIAVLLFHPVITFYDVIVKPKKQFCIQYSTYYNL